MKKTGMNRINLVATVMLAVGLAALALPGQLAAQTPVMEVKDNIVKVNGVTTNGAVDLHIISGSGQDAILGMGLSPSFLAGNTDALIFGYNGAFEVGSGFIGTRPTSGSGNIGFFIKNIREVTFSSDGINLEAGNDYKVNGVSLIVPDFVFEDSYSLMPLDQLASFVETNKHLPGIPSESEIKGSSLGLAGFQMKLLEKVEELTLYTLDQEQRIASIQQENARLESTNAELHSRLAAMEQKLDALLP